MSKNLKLLNSLIIMANMSATILRSIVSSVFKVNAASVILSGEIAPNWKGYNTTGISHCDHTETGVFGIWGFHPKTGFTKIDGVISNTHMYHGNHSHDVTDCNSLDTVKGVEEFIFFVIFSGDDSDLPYSMVYSIYKAPNFKEYFQKVEESDIQRWSTWIQA